MISNTISYPIFDNYQIPNSLFGKSWNNCQSKGAIDILDDIENLDELDVFLFNVISFIFETQVGRNKLCLKACNETWGQLEERYKYLDAYQNLLDDDIEIPVDAFYKPKESSFKKLKTIYKYLAGDVETNSLNLQYNCLPELLKFVKMYDLAISLFNLSNLGTYTFQRGSYKLREIILEKMPNFCSFEVFSKTLSKYKISQISYMENSNNWVDERVGLHAKLYANTIISAMSFAKHIKIPRLEGVRGNTAVGKTTALGKNIGVLNPDTIKMGLRKWTDIKNHQIHREGSIIFKICFDEIANHSTLRYIIDLRMKTLEDIKKYLVEPAKKRKCKVYLSDFDAPLITSFNRVLNRDPKGEDPVPSIHAIASGHMEIRWFRKDIVSYAEKEPIIKQYNIYYLGKIVAKKVWDKIIVIDRQGFEECMRFPTCIEIDNILKLVIDDKYIQDALTRGDLRAEEKETLESKKGMTLKHALETHVCRQK